MSQRVQRRNFVHHVHAAMHTKRHSHRYRRKNANPSVPGENAKKWKYVQQKHSSEPDQSESHAVSEGGEEILRHAANDISRARMPAHRNKILRDRDARAK